MRLEGFDPREVRRLIVGDYELRYEINDDGIVVLRIFHGLEDRCTASAPALDGRWSAAR